MSPDDKCEKWTDCLCVCEEYWECEWHKRLRQPDTERRELAAEMEEIIFMSHGIERGEFDLPDGWVRFRGRNRDYWRPV
jgi:hypothetical protein